MKVRKIQAESSDDESSSKNDCNVLADLRLLHRLDRADRGTQKLLDEETVAALQEGLQSIYGMTIVEADKMADRGPYSLIQEANGRANGKMRRCWLKYEQSLEMVKTNGS